MSKSPVFGTTPLQLIRIDGDSNLIPVEETLEAIRSIREPVSALIIAGPYHKGKSFLLNAVAGITLDKERRGFAVGRQTEAETKGLWVLARKSGSKVQLLIDTEGIDAPGNATTADSRIFSAALLLASLLVYNTSTLIEEASLRQLSFVSSLAQHVSTDAEARTSLVFPRLLWLVRDFGYWRALEDKHNNSPKEYMERVLSNDENDDSVRVGLNKIFPADRRDCFLLPTPAFDTEALADGSLDPADFHPKFIAKLKELTGEVLPPLLQAKRRGSTLLDGAAYAELVAICCDGMNEQVDAVDLFLPNIRSKFALNESQAFYENGMDAAADKFPVEDKILEAAHVALRDEALRLFESKAYGPTKDKLADQLAAKLEERHALFAKRNTDLRDRAYMGFGDLQTVLLVAAVLVVVLSLSSLSTSIVLLGALAIAYNTGHFFVAAKHVGTGVRSSRAWYEAHGREYANANPNVVIGAILAVVSILIMMINSVGSG